MVAKALDIPLIPLNPAKFQLITQDEVVWVVSQNLSTNTHAMLRREIIPNFGFWIMSCPPLFILANTQCKGEKIYWWHYSKLLVGKGRHLLNYLWQPYSILKTKCIWRNLQELNLEFAHNDVH